MSLVPVTRDLAVPALCVGRKFDMVHINDILFPNFLLQFPDVGNTSHIPCNENMTYIDI